MSDDPHYFASAPCWSCHRLFTFNPHKVPSIPIDPATGEASAGGVRHPVCRDCARLANAYREAHGLPLWDVSDEAYESVRGLPE
jgi:hypothetical protein